MSDVSRRIELADHAWSVADLLRGDYKRSEYGKVILPFTVLRRLECVLAPTRGKVLETYERFRGQDVDVTRFLRRAAGHSFHNISGYTLKSITDDPAQVAARHLLAYVDAFSDNVREVLHRYELPQQVRRLDSAGLLNKVVGRFADLDLDPFQRDSTTGEVRTDEHGQPLVNVDNHLMGYVFEELIRRFAEQSSETVGERFTPREVIELMVNLLVAPDGDALSVPGVVRTVLDPACGTGGMLSAAEEHITRLNPSATVRVFGQESDPESWAICRSALMVKGQDPENITFGNSLRDDGHRGAHFDYLLASPPFGARWQEVRDEVETEAEKLGGSGRFGAGLPRINDGSLLFLQHMISKMKPVTADGEGGSRIAILVNGSPLFAGAAGSGESRIRRWILENDWLEGIVALPDQLFHNTGSSTYLWILTNRKPPEHRGTVILLDAREHFAKMRKSLGDKRKRLEKDHIEEITDLYSQALHVAKDPTHPLHAKVKVFDNEDFGYRRITVERPLKLRFEVTEETLTQVRESKPIAKAVDVDAFTIALQPLVGRSWDTKQAAWDAVRGALTESGLRWPTGAPFAEALRGVLGVRDPEGEVQRVTGEPEPDPQLRDYVNVPLHEDIEEYLTREVLPHVPDAWIDHSKTRIGYEITFTRHFYVYKPPGPLAGIDAELNALEAEIQALLGEVTT